MFSVRLVPGAFTTIQGTSIYCRERAEDKVDGAQKQECTQST